MQSDFAPDYDRSEDGLVLFPADDTQYRKELFPFWTEQSISLSEHPAKANLFLVQACIEYVSEPGETVMDIMAGTGSIMVAALIGRRVVCIELEEMYQEMLDWAVENIERIAPGASEMITIIPGDCSKLLPLPVADHIIFSPPYAQIMKKKVLDRFTAEKMGAGILEYSASPENIGNLNEFLYHQKMEVIYKKSVESLPTGGTITIIIKDHISGGERVHLGERAMRDCCNAGMSLVSWHQWKPSGSAYLKVKRARGEPVVSEEDIIVLRKEEDNGS